MARIVFMGTPQYAQQILQGIWRPTDEWLIVTKPDVPVGRHRTLTPVPVAQWTMSRGLQMLRPRRMKDIEHELKSFDPHWILTAAFGRILAPGVLEIPQYGAYNLHASLLPRWRGANPIAWAIAAGDKRTGVTLMKMDAGVDTGPIVASREVAIDERDTTGTLTARLATVAVSLWNDVRAQYGDGPLPADPQPLEGVTYAPKFEMGTAYIDWDQDRFALDRWIRSMLPEPGVFTRLGERRIKVLAANPCEESWDGPPGEVRPGDQGWRVQVRGGSILLRQIQPVGGRPMTPQEFSRGYRGEGPWILG